MKKVKAYLYLAIPLLCACSGNKPDMYIHTHDDANTDIFYVCSTETSDWINEQGDTMHFVDMTKPEHRAALYSEMRGVDSLVCPETCNFYAPYYNQATIEGLLRDTADFVPRCAKAAEEIVQAFDYYMQHENGGRKFVLIGYSQGGYAVVELLKHLTDEQASRMVAAYVIGYQVTEEDLRCPHIRAAQGATDTGVTICYNSVASAKAEIPILSGSTVLGINPVNWCTNATPATYVCDFGGTSDTLTATLDTVTHLTVIEGYKGACSIIPFVGKQGNYHCLEIPLYAHSLRENIAQRCQTDRTMDRSDFVVITDVIPDAILEIRYYSTYNFVGARIDGYELPIALMTRQAADSLKVVSDELKAKGYRIKIWDAYRPQRAVNHFIRWAENLQDTAMKSVFYPMVDKSLLFEQGYIMARSGHSRGSTVDLTLVDAVTGKELDMGSPFDWFGVESHPDYKVESREWQANRKILWDAMLRHGFTMIDSEWWHFTLANEPYPDTYFDFPIR